MEDGGSSITTLWGEKVAGDALDTLQPRGTGVEVVLRTIPARFMDDVKKSNHDTINPSLRCERARKDRVELIPPQVGSRLHSGIASMSTVDSTVDEIRDSNIALGESLFTKILSVDTASAQAAIPQTRWLCTYRDGKDNKDG